MAKYKRGRDLRDWKSNRPQANVGKLRIIGGELRGRQIEYSGDPVTRPMKDNIREALFNLVGGWVKGKAVFDLFAGTGAIGIEALSRGATGCTFIERHIPTVRILTENVRSLDLGNSSSIHSSDTFFWGRQFAKNERQRPREPWAVFCSPPYDFFVERWKDLDSLLLKMIELAPPESLFAVESDDRFDPSRLPFSDSWVTRQYAPAVLSVRNSKDFQAVDEADPDRQIG